MRTPKLYQTKRKMIAEQSIHSWFFSIVVCVMCSWFFDLLTPFTPFIHIAVFAFNYVDSFVSINVCECFCLCVCERIETPSNTPSYMNILQIIFTVWCIRRNCVHKLFHQSNLYTVCHSVYSSMLLRIESCLFTSYTLNTFQPIKTPQHTLHWYAFIFILLSGNCVDAFCYSCRLLRCERRAWKENSGQRKICFSKWFFFRSKRL